MDKQAYKLEDVVEIGIDSKKKLETLIGETESNLYNDLFWLPISSVSREHFFDKEWTYWLGIYDGNRLVAAGALFFNENEYGESASILKIEGKKNAEIGRLMVLSEYRRRGYAKKICKALVEYAKRTNMEYVVATAHPENTPSQNVLAFVGMNKEARCIKQQKYVRDVFVMKI